jgi:hypothetical protein
MKGFEPIPWADSLPNAGPMDRTFDEAVSAWHSCWHGATVRNMIANLPDCGLVDETACPPVTQTGAAVIRQAWICSPWSAFGPYAFAEAAKVRRGWSRLGARTGALASAMVLAAASPDRCLQVRNFLFSTPIHPPEQDGTALAAHMRRLAEKSGVPVLCRGLAKSWRSEEIEAAQAAGLIALPTRAVWLYDGPRPTFLARHNTQMDLRLAHRAQPLRLIEPHVVEPWVWERLADLYSQLYLEKHNRLNPAYTATFMKAAAVSGLVEFLVFPAAGGTGLDAFVGLFSGAGQSTCPLVGVETRVQKERGLYRICCALCFGLAAARRHQLNFSSGAGHFKRLRGGEQSLEYALVAVPEASVMKRKFWQVLSSTVEKHAAPMLLKEGL